MQCPSLNELPLPPDGKTGWPWTEESRRISATRPKPNAWPRLTIVTPSFNQAQYIEQTIRSVLLQGYPDLEYIVLDGGSTDRTVETIRKYSKWLSFWTSEPDGGQSAAINRGLKMATGLYANWINSDDMLCKDALGNQLKTVEHTGRNVSVGDCVHINQDGQRLYQHRGCVASLLELLQIETVWRQGGSLDQPAMLFPRELAIEVGGVNEKNHHTMDYELWGKFFLAGARFEFTGVPVGIFRHHDQQKTADMLKQTDSLIQTATALLAEAPFSTDEKAVILADLKTYAANYPVELWKHSGRLARFGLPARLVTAIRSMRRSA